MISYFGGNLTPLFAVLYFDKDVFYNDWLATSFADASSDELGKSELDLIYDLLISKYGERPIASLNINHFKSALFRKIYENFPTLFARQRIQKKLRDLTLDENEEALLTGSMQVFNTATVNGTPQSDETYKNGVKNIKGQNVQLNQRSKLEAYLQVYSIINEDLTEVVLERFDELFNPFGAPQDEIMFRTPDYEGGY